MPRIGISYNHQAFTRRRGSFPRHWRIRQREMAAHDIDEYRLPRRQRWRSRSPTQEELAAELGVTHQHISRIEGGHAVPSLDLLVRLSGRLGVSTDYLLTGQKTTTPGIDGAIRGDQRLSAPAKRHLIGIISELRGAA
jgi:transcriptional regulator with XRE-family HTH domain